MRGGPPAGSPIRWTRGFRSSRSVLSGIAAGDLVVVPAGVPHQVTVESGEAVTYLIVKVRVAGGGEGVE